LFGSRRCAPMIRHGPVIALVIYRATRENPEAGGLLLAALSWGIFHLERRLCFEILLCFQATRRNKVRSLVQLRGVRRGKGARGGDDVGLDREEAADLDRLNYGDVPAR